MMNNQAVNNFLDIDMRFLILIIMIISMVGGCSSYAIDVAGSASETGNSEKSGFQHRDSIDRDTTTNIRISEEP